MHLYKVQLLVIAATLLEFTSCFTTVIAANTLTVSKLAPAEQNGLPIVILDTYRKTSLRSLKAGDSAATEEEERAFSFSFLKKLNKYVPGTESFKNAAVLRAKAKELKKAKDAAKKVDPTFKLTGTRDHELHPKFKEWYNKYSPDEIEQGLIQAGRTEKEANDIRMKFIAWRIM
ncbi:putative RxLR effector [Phytophthora palmivora]|uniref:RxLR effector n=1 Tax=Phytophthora palmivora TaxID=4796 RepID=A0A2P4XAP9_9STRA|nr:putative RxLR effector [Phytophthora palmivora]